VRTIAVVNLKGGSGKTTTALCLAVGLARRLSKRKQRALLIDADPQANATMTMLDGEIPNAPTLGQVLLGEARASQAIRPSRVPRIDILPADVSLADCTVLMADQIGRERRLLSALRSVVDAYDLVLVDGPPRLDLITVNVLQAVEEIIVPVDSGIYSVAGLSKLQETVEMVRKHLDHDKLHISGLVLTRVMRNKATKDLERHLREAFPDLVYETPIPYSVRVEEAAARHRTILEWAPKSPPAVAYDRLITEVCKHGQRTKRHAHSDPATDHSTAA
jgi:chromosome partitioning protein